MKQFLRFLCALSLFSLPALAQTITGGQLAISCNAVTATGTCTAYSLQAPNGQLPGAFTWQTITTGGPASVSITFEGSIDGTNWTTLDTSTATGGEIRSVTGKPMRQIRCNLGTFSGGVAPTMTCQFTVTTSSAGGGGGGGGGGTVTHTGGALASNAVVLGNAGADIKTTTAFTTNGTNQLTVGVAAGGNGVLALAGNTSGSATLTAPATAGTITNPLVLSNSLNVSGPQVTVSAAGNGNGVLALSGNTSGTATFTAPAVAGTVTNAVSSSNALSFPGTATASATSGAVIVGAGNPLVTLATTSNSGSWANANSAAVNFGSTSGMDNCSATSGGLGFHLATATVWCLDGGGNWFVNNGSRYNRTSGSCTITADITLPVNTTTTICSFSLPAIAYAWSWQCSILWTITAGTGTNNLAISVNPSQTPTGTTNGEAQIYTATSGTQTMGAVAISASGSTTLLTGATYTPAATIQLAKTSGTLLASATAGTFVIAGTANGTTATAAAKAGSTCYLY